MPDTKESAVEKVRKLINLASSPNLKEAEHAAHKACALIRAHGLDVCDPDEIDAIYQQQATLEARVKQLEAPKEVVNDLDYSNFAQNSTFAQKVGYATATNTPFGVVQGPAVKGQSVYVNINTAQASYPPMTAPRWISSRFDDQCKQCRKRYTVGESVFWMKGAGAWCSEQCYTIWGAAKKGVSGVNFQP